MTVRSSIWFVNLLEPVKLLAYVFIVQLVGGLVCLWDCIEATRTSLTECWRASSATFDSHRVRCQLFARCNSNDSSVWLASYGHWKISPVRHCYWLIFATSESVFASRMGLFVQWWRLFKHKLLGNTSWSNVCHQIFLWKRFFHLECQRWVSWLEVLV